jgi:diguanylate cyclase (GGDEF)-like protein
MGYEGDRGVVDTSTLRMREATIVTGVWLTYLVGGLGGVYAALTWQRPNRPLLAVIFGTAIVAAIVFSLLPRERIVRSRYREVFFLGWTFLDFAMIVIGTILDGGTTSPLTVVFFIPVVFSSMSYPLGSVAVVGTMSVVTYLLVAFTSGGSSLSYEVSFAVVLGCTTVMSAWQAQNHNRQREALAKVSRADPLTGCLNRRGFEQRAKAEIESAARESREGALMMLDLDHFKPVNDRYGHAAGDQLLCWVVQTLERMVRAGDAVGRLGGDEFAVLFSEIYREEVLTTVRRIADELSQRAPCSIGVATFPVDGVDLEGLTRRADGRLYESRGGRAHEDSQVPAELPGRGTALASTIF